MKQFNFAKRHKDFSQKLWDKVASQPEELVKSQATPESRKLFNLSRNASMSLCLNKGFARLKSSKHGILYGKIEPEHYIEDLICWHFVNRFPMFYIVLESDRGTFIGKKGKRIQKITKPMQKVVNDLEKVLPINNIINDLNNELINEEEVWKTFYKSHFIKERKNTKYFNRIMPKKYRKTQSLQTEMAINRKEKLLTEF